MTVTTFLVTFFDVDQKLAFKQRNSFLKVCMAQLLSVKCTV